MTETPYRQSSVASIEAAELRRDIKDDVENS
jgi:hypothetical protein